MEAHEHGCSWAACAQALSESAPAMGIIPLVDFTYGCRLRIVLIIRTNWSRRRQFGAGAGRGWRRGSGKKSKRPDLNVYNTERSSRRWVGRSWHIDMTPRLKNFTSNTNLLWKQDEIGLCSHKYIVSFYNGGAHKGTETIE